MCRNWNRIDEPRAWAIKAVKNNLIKIKKRETQQQQTAANGYATPGAHHDDDRLSECEERQLVESLLNMLPPAQRKVMSLVADGLRPAEIAAALGTSQPGVRKNLERARARLKTVVRQEYHSIVHLDETHGGDDVNDGR